MPDPLWLRLARKAAQQSDPDLMSMADEAKRLEEITDDLVADSMAAVRGGGENVVRFPQTRVGGSAR